MRSKDLQVCAKKSSDLYFKTEGVAYIFCQLPSEPSLIRTPEAPWGSNPTPVLFCRCTSSSYTARQPHTTEEGQNRNLELPKLACDQGNKRRKLSKAEN